MKLPKEIRTNKYLLDGLICRMWFRNVNMLKHENKACISYRTIASIVGMSYDYSRRACQQHLNGRLATATKSIVKSRSKKLEEAQQYIRPNKLNALHLEHLTSEATLKR